MDISTVKNPNAWFCFLLEIILGIIICDPPRISRNQGNARTRHVITRSRASSITRLSCRYDIKTIDSGKRVGSHFSYLASAVEL